MSRRFASSGGKVKTGVVALNMGGPSDPATTPDFLMNLFSDPEIIPMGGGFVQRKLAERIVKRRSPKVQKQYEAIGGSPIGKWTREQLDAMCKILDERSPESAPHKGYIAFRYAAPMTESALREMHADGVEHAIAFSQYPQWCCSTTGSSLNHLWREVKRTAMDDAFQWSIIDRWFDHRGYIDALVDRIVEAMLANTHALEPSKKPLILFSAHSVPLKTVTRGDPYVFEVSATVKAVIARLREVCAAHPELSRFNFAHQLCWQSKVGFLPWMTPATEQVIKSYGKNKRHESVFVVPFVFTSDHIETLYELDIEYRDVAKEVGLKDYIRVPALNAAPMFVDAMADIVAEHVKEGRNHSADYPLRCHNCVNESCRKILKPKFELQGIEKLIE